MTNIDAETLFGKNYLGPRQVNILMERMGLELIDIENVPPINYDYETLQRCASDYLLVYGIDKLDILDIRNHFGTNPDIVEPCLYNQDWYLSEEFVHRKMQNKWYLLKKEVYDNTRTIMPVDILYTGVKFPSAILCVYAFFAYLMSYGEFLWYHDFVWCDDCDHNGDRIYVGKYHDIDGVNKNGFSIHRHLSLRPCYGAISVL